MSHQNTGEGAEFYGEIAIADRVQRVFCRLGKAQFRGGKFAIYRIGCTCQSRGTQWALIKSGAAVQQTTVISFQHFIPGQQVMTKGHWLGSLKVGKPWHNSICFRGGKCNHAFL